MSADLAVEAHAQLGALALDVALHVAPGECLALAGPSGAGKSSILRIVAGLLRPHEGTVRCADEIWLDTTRGIDVAPDHRRCGYVFQEYALFGHLSAWQNVAFGMRDVARGQRRERALALLERFGMSALADAQPRTLSGGERQRVALARALARNPSALLLDEPLSALDARTRAAAARELQRTLAQVGVPALLVTHDFTEAAAFGHQVGVIDGGRVVQQGSPAELATRPRSAFVADFTGASVLTGTALPRERGLTRVRLDGGGELTSTDATEPGAVAASIFPWEIAIEPIGVAARGSARNHLEAEVISITEIGERVRIGLATPQPLAVEVTRDSVAELGLSAGSRVIATFKASATRITPR